MTDTTHKPLVLGVFPGLDPRQGGVQVSAIEAVGAFTQRKITLDAILLGSDPGAVLAGARQVIIGQSQQMLVAKLPLRTWHHDIAIFWHIGMLKLLPFMRGFRGKVVLFLHGIEVWRPPGWLTRRVLRRVDHFVSNSDFTWKRFLEFAPNLANKPHTTTHLGVGAAFPRATTNPGSVPAALILGRMAAGEDYKGHRELISAWPRVRQQIPDAELWIAGDGELRPAFEQHAAELGMSNAIRFFGRVSEVQKAELLAASRCLALPSRGEGFGLVYLEAMRVGRPCLVSDADAAREVVDPPHAGLAVDVGCPDAVAAAVVRLLTPGDEWRGWSTAAKTRFENHFTGDHFRGRLCSAIFGGS